MTKNLKATITVVLVAAGVLAAMLLLNRPSNPPPAAQESPAAPQASTELLVREDSHRLSTAADGRVTFVEFLDFECEACGGAYPAVEQLRRDYAGRVTFVARYFPLSGHRNGENAALAVEAAAQQGRFEAMYQRMFETQKTWGEQQDSEAPLFRQYATELGLDIAAYNRAVIDPATLERVRADQRDGQALGVDSTPTFFLNGQRLEPRSLDDLRAALDRALDQ